MPTLFWTGKISFPLRLLVNAGSIIAWLSGNARDVVSMKERMRDGYNGEYSEYAFEYDDIASFHYSRVSNILLSKVDCAGKRVVDVGCGTGILSILALDKGASEMSCVDISRSMLDRCQEKAVAAGYTGDIVSFHEGDAERLPLDDASYDVAFSNMVLGMVPDQPSAIEELTRVLCPGGMIALSMHGPSHYREAIESGLRSMNLRYFVGHRFEYWPRDENQMANLLTNAGLDSIRTERLAWVDEFENGGQAFDFFASSTGLWFYHRLPPEIRAREEEGMRSYFQRRGVTQVTSDVVFATGTAR